MSRPAGPELRELAAVQAALRRFGVDGPEVEEGRVRGGSPAGSHL
jgi:hypothetical protein